MAEKKINRVLVWGLTNSLAGTEAVISSFSRALAGQVYFDYLLFEEPTNFADLFDGTGNRYFVIPNKRLDPRGYYRELDKHFKAHASEYSAAWVNLNILNNIDVLKYACRYDIPHRILHSHNSAPDGNLHQRILCALHKGSFEKYVTDRWACSKEAGEFFFGQNDFTVLPNAIAEEKFAYDEQARNQLRESLGFAPDQRIVGAVGRLTNQKNIKFLLDVWPHVIAEAPDARLVLVGKGELKDELEAQADALGITSSVTFAGVQRNIPAYLSAFDAYAMPSLYEGLPISLLEVQYNGLPAVISDAISDEAVISTGVTKLPLDNVEKWAQALLDASRTQCQLTERADEYRIKNVAGRLLEVFNSVQ